jgi:phosphonate transport system permease protein
MVITRKSVGLDGPGVPPTRVSPVLDYAEYRRRNRALGRNRAVIWAIIAAAFVWAMWGTGFGFLTLVVGIKNATEFVFTDLWPPRLDGITEFIRPALVTVYMSYVAMIMSIVLSIPLGVLAARNTTLHISVSWVSTAITAFIRAVPELVIAIFLVAVFGIGPLAGTIAMGVGGVGILAKAYADALEAIDMRQVEGIRSAGGTRVQILGQGVWPQFKPSFVSWSLYRFDLNIRTGAVLGLVGAGGIGHSLLVQINLFQYKAATTIILMIFVLILIVEMVTGILRKKAL